MNVDYPRNRQGFTLVELLIVVGIIAILVSILVPVVGKMRQTGYKTDTANQLSVLRTAVEMYHQTFQAYPGPFSNTEVCDGSMKVNNTGGDTITMAENLVLGLAGGIEPAVRGRVPTYNKTMVGTGPRSLDVNNPKRYDPFVTTNPGWLSDGRFKEFGMPKGVCQDSDVPEYVDRYPSQPMPILYLRARVGAPGIINAGNSRELFQYDIRQITPYTDTTIYGAQQGLRTVGKDLNAPLVKGVNDDALPYFRNRELTFNTNTAKTLRDGVPRSKDSFILISAGQDRIYGTLDDITTFGDVAD
ncbi:MAG TPA: type II secretion system protein [Tepidisphaeraceae bacterium]|nr:type II secretion system protein [Tepidisphaeraceae bacterium]